jgi:hypothetical protein
MCDLQVPSFTHHSSFITDTVTTGFSQHLLSLLSLSPLPACLLSQLIKHFPYTTNPYFVFGQAKYVVCVWAIHLASVLCFVLGWHTRIAAPIVWYMHRCLTLRTPRTTDMGDNLVIMLTFWVCFCPISNYFSFDSARESYERFIAGKPVSTSSPTQTQTQTAQNPNRYLWYGIGAVGLVLQPVILYVLSGWEKIGDKLWNTGTAIYYITNRPLDGTSFSHWLHSTNTIPQEAWQFATVMTVIGELLVPLMLISPWFNRSMRFWGWLSLEILQIGMWTFMYLVLFPYASFSSVIPCMPPLAWGGFIAILRSVTCSDSRARVVHVELAVHGSNFAYVFFVLRAFVLQPMFAVANIKMEIVPLIASAKADSEAGLSMPFIVVKFDSEPQLTNGAAISRLLSHSIWLLPLRLVLSVLCSLLFSNVAHITDQEVELVKMNRDKDTMIVKEEEYQQSRASSFCISKAATAVALMGLWFQTWSVTADFLPKYEPYMPHQWGMMADIQDWTMLTHQFVMYTGLDNEPDYIFVMAHTDDDQWIDPRNGYSVRQWSDTLSGTKSIAIERMNLVLESVIDDTQGITIHGRNVPTFEEIEKATKGKLGGSTEKPVKGGWPKRLHFAVQKYYCRQSSAKSRYTHVYLGRVFEKVPPPGAPRRLHADTKPRREIIFRIECLQHNTSETMQQQNMAIFRHVYGDQVHLDNLHASNDGDGGGDSDHADSDAIAYDDDDEEEDDEEDDEGDDGGYEDDDDEDEDGGYEDEDDDEEDGDDDDDDDDDGYGDEDDYEDDEDVINGL